MCVCGGEGSFTTVCNVNCALICDVNDLDLVPSHLPCTLSYYPNILEICCYGIHNKFWLCRVALVLVQLRPQFFRRIFLEKYKNSFCVKSLRDLFYTTVKLP